MKIRALMIVAVLSLLFLSPPATAQEYLNYFTVKLGMYSPTGDLEDLDYDTDFNGEIVLGYYFEPNLCVEGGIGYFKTGGSWSGWGPISGAWSEDDEVTVIPLTLTVKGVFRDQMIEFYGGAGIGFYFGTVDIDYRDEAVGPLSFDDTDEVFGFHFLLGVNVNVSPSAFLGIEWKNILTQDAKVSDVVSGIPISMKGDVNGYMITANLGFRF